MALGCAGGQSFPDLSGDIGDHPVFFLCLAGFNKSEKECTFLSVNAEAIDDEPVFYKEITPQAIALGHFYFFGNP